MRAGWHLRLPEGDDTRTVLRRPLGRATKAVPKDVRSPVRVLVRDRQLAPVARVSTRRLKAKRLRYTAESTVPVLRRRARKLAASAKGVQGALGEHQDTVMSRQRLRDYGVRAHLNGENGFTFGRLHALEQMHAYAAERAFETAWNTIPRKNMRRWVRG